MHRIIYSKLTAFFVDCMLLIFHTCIAFNSYSSLLAAMLVGVNVQHTLVNTDSIFSTSYITFIYRRCIYSSARGAKRSISASLFFLSSLYGEVCVLCETSRIMAVTLHSSNTACSPCDCCRHTVPLLLAVLTVQ